MRKEGGEYMADWFSKRLDEIIEFNPHEKIKKGIIAKKIAMDKLQPFCRDITEFELEPFSGGTKFRNGDTIMARITPCLENGKAAKVNILNDGEVGFGSTEYIVFRAREGVDADFVYYLISSPLVREPAIKSMVGSSGRQRVQTDVVQGITVMVPMLEEQKAIAGILKMLDDKIAVNRKINDNLLQQASTIFRHWFTDNPNLDTMEQVPLADLCLIITKGTTPTTLGKPFVSEGINFLKAESILDNHAIDKDKFAFIDSKTNDLLRRSIISSGDIVFTIAGTLGRFALIDDSILPANTNQAVAIIRADQSKVAPEYLYSFFLGNWHNDYYTKRIQQAVQANLSLGTIKSLPIPILSDKAMPEYLGIISPIITMTKANELEITRLRTIRDALLPQLMSGQLDVSNLDF